ncbi:hypothetical protein D9611_003786 [Ephemerocybe angulata]|uniref:Uncharacterized protein n=1 Tax=Ephemerocybe angulata TaxID=980116 RepID=A0A8H5B6A0_9AGAR|nr:hypothetical protein D9611_003786 [Tulosesus angulatus]
MIGGAVDTRDTKVYYSPFKLVSLTPACILSFAVTAVARGEFADAWAWNDLPEEEGENAQKQKGDGNPLKKKEGLVVDSVGVLKSRSTTPKEVKHSGGRR